MFPHSCALRPWVGEVLVFYSLPTPSCPRPHQLTTVYMGSHSSQTTEVAAPNSCKTEKSLLGRWNEARSAYCYLKHPRVQGLPLQLDPQGGVSISQSLRKGRAGRPGRELPKGVACSLSWL